MMMAMLSEESCISHGWFDGDGDGIFFQSEADATYINGLVTFHQ